MVNWNKTYSILCILLIKNYIACFSIKTNNSSTQNINKNTNDKFEDFCPGKSKTISCASVGGKVELTDAFYGISSATPPVCVYNNVTDVCITRGVSPIFFLVVFKLDCDNQVSCDIYASTLNINTACGSKPPHYLRINYYCKDVPTTTTISSTTTTTTSTTSILTTESLKTSEFISSTEEAQSIMTNKISLSTSAYIFLTTDSTSVTSTFDLTLSETTVFMTPPDSSTSVKEETTSEAFIFSTISKEITYTTELTLTTDSITSSEFTTSTKETNSVGFTFDLSTSQTAVLPKTDSSTSESMTTLDKSTSLKEETISRFYY